MTDELAPALTPDEWAYFAAAPEHWMGKRNAHATEADHHVAIAQLDASTSRHGLAALCLYQQPFGFEQADVEALLKLLTFQKVGAGDLGVEEEVYRIMHRIAALLPPPPPPMETP